MSEARQTAGWAAGVLCDHARFGLAEETRFGEPSTGDFRQVRLSGASLSLSQARAYPEERNPRAERACGVTTQFAGSGTLESLLSFGNQDALISGALCANWRDGSITNGIERKSWTLRQRLGDGWLYRQGVFVRSLTLSAAQDGFAQLACNVLYSGETIIPDDDAAADDPPPSRAPLHPCASRLALALPGAVDPGILRSVSLTFGRDNAALGYGAGSPFAREVRPGLFSASASIEVMLRGHGAYEALLGCKTGPFRLSIIGRDGYGYAFTLPAAQICTPRINACSRNAILLVGFDIEALPASQSAGMISVSVIRPVDYEVITVNDNPVLNNNNTISP